MPNYLITINYRLPYCLIIITYVSLHTWKLLIKIIVTEIDWDKPLFKETCENLCDRIGILSTTLYFRNNIKANIFYNYWALSMCRCKSKNYKCRWPEKRNVSDVSIVHHKSISSVATASYGEIYLKETYNNFPEYTKVY